MYNLLTDGIRDLARYTSLLQAKPVAREPMMGLVDGSNTTFYTQVSPMLASGSLSVYVSGSINAYSSVDYDTGTVILANAPTKQPAASYTFTPFTTSQSVSMLMAGFDEMMSRWVRPNWYLSSGSVNLTNPTDTDTAIWIVYQQTSGSLIDPQCSGSLPFSQLRTQVRLYMACCEYAYLSRQLTENALTGVSYRERFGTAIDRTKIAPNLKLALDNAEKSVVRTLRAAWDETYTSGEQYGLGIAPDHSVGYETQFNWHGEEEYPVVSDGDLRWL